MAASNSKIINIMHNEKALSIETAYILKEKLRAEGFEICCHTSRDAKNAPKDSLVNICIGGDGAFLRAVHSSNFSQTPFLGINTGHLGFFQEIDPNNMDILVESLKHESYCIRQMDLVQATVYCKTKKYKLKAINEFALKGISSKVVHLDVLIDDDMFEKVSGDGVIISTPIGSTAYNFSCGGSIVSPKLKTLQLTPIAPIVSKAYRCMINSLIIPSSSSVIIRPENQDEDSIVVIADGVQHKYSQIEEIKFEISDETLKKMVVNSISFWNNVRKKFL